MEKFKSSGQFHRKEEGQGFMPESEQEKRERLRDVLQRAYDSVTVEGEKIKGFPVRVVRKLEDGTTETISGLLVWSFDEGEMLFVGVDPESNAATMGWEEIEDVSIETNE